MTHHWLLDYDGFFFDFDGLLVDSERLHYKALLNALEQIQIDLAIPFLSFIEKVHQTETGGLKGLLQQHSPSLCQPENWKHFYHKKQKHYLTLIQREGVTLMPGVKQVLDCVHGSTHCVVTNSPRKQVELIRDHLPCLNKIPIWITREDYLHAKPLPDPYLEGIHRCGLEQAGKKLIGFEDSLRGLQALQAASITPVLICPEEHLQFSQIDQKTVLYFPSLAALYAAPKPFLPHR